MKSKLLFAGLIMLGLTSKAQFGEKGQRLINGEFGISHYTISDPFSNGSKATTSNIALSLGKFKKQHVLTSYSLFAGFSNNENNNPTVSTTNSSSYYIGASYSQTYFKPLGKKLFFGIGGKGSISYGSTKNDISGSTNKNTSQMYSVSVALVPVLSYQLSNRFVINLSPSTSFLSVDFSRTVNKTTPSGITYSANNRIYLNTGFWSSPLSNTSIGFSYLLKRK
jgi:hypothetical protein